MDIFVMGSTTMLALSTTPVSYEAYTMSR